MSETPSPSSSPFSVPKDDHVWGLVAHALTFVEGGILGPLLLYVFMKEKSEFVAFHALQSFYFGLLFLVVTLVTCGFGALIFVIPYLIWEIIACVRANEGEWYRLPIVGNWAWRKHHP